MNKHRRVLIRDGWVTYYLIIGSKNSIKRWHVVKRYRIHGHNLKHRIRSNKYIHLLRGPTETYEDYQDYLDCIEQVW